MNGKLLKERIEVLHKIIEGTYKDYFNPNTNQGQRGLYETVLGATIWYLPGGGALYSGKISAGALDSLATCPEETKLVEEHSFPPCKGATMTRMSHHSIGGCYSSLIPKESPLLDSERCQI